MAASFSGEATALSVMQGNELFDFQLKGYGRRRQDRNGQHTAFLDFKIELHFFRIMSVGVSEMIRQGQQGFGDQIGGENLPLVNVFLRQLFTADAGHDAQLAVPDIAEPAEEPEIGPAFVVIGTVKKERLGAEIVRGLDACFTHSGSFRFFNRYRLLCRISFSQCYSN